MNMLGIGESSREPVAAGHCIPPGGSCTMQPDRPAAVRGHLHIKALGDTDWELTKLTPAHRSFLPLTT